MLIRTGNHGNEFGCKNKYDEERYTLKKLEENYKNGHYYECTILIMNYLGHIEHYCTHEQLVYNLLTSLTYSIETGQQDFPTYIRRLIGNVNTYEERGL